METVHFLVSVRCMTYNHSQYIEHTLDGFTMQQTNFPFVCVIMDDDSHDGEPEVIKSYLEKHFILDDDSFTRCEETNDYVMTFAQHKDNNNCYFAVYLLKYNHYRKKDKYPYYSYLEKNAKYIAICEGDDYWSCPLKLQKQVSILENNPDCSIVHSRFSFFDNYNKQYKNDEIIHQRILSISNKTTDRIKYEILNQNKYRIQTVTVMFRKSSYERIKKFEIEENGFFLMGDTQLWINLLSIGNVFYLKETTSVYRISEESSSRSNLPIKQARFNLSCCEMRLFYAKKNELPSFLFFLRYIKYLLIYKAYEEEYVTNPKINMFGKIEKMIVSMVSHKIFIRLFSFFNGIK